MSHHHDSQGPLVLDFYFFARTVQHRRHHPHRNRNRIFIEVLIEAENLRFNMKRARKSNRVSWAPGANLRQVKLFLSEDCPSKVGQKSQDHLQAKTSSMLNSSTNECNDLPPGFEGSHFLNQSKHELSHISQIKWECPPQLVLDYHWCVVAGEESREKDNQKLREMRVLEEVYPRLSAIPPGPYVSTDVEEEDYDDNLTPLVPIISLEDEESMDIKPELAVAGYSATNLQSQNSQQYIPATFPISSQCNISSTVPSPACGKPSAGLSSGREVDLAAASAVVAAIMKSNEQGSMIDMDLLVRIFNDPKMIEKLINEHRTVATSVSAPSNTVGIPTSGLKPATQSVPLSTPTTDEEATRTSTVGSSPASGLKQATPSVSLLMPTPDTATPSASVLTSTADKPATPSVPLSRHLPGKPATPTPSVPLSRALPGKPATPTPSVPLSRPIPGKLETPSVSLPTPTLAPHMHRPVNKNIHNMSNGVLITHPPQQDKVLSSSGVNRAASLASVSSIELSTVPLPSSSVNLRAVPNQVQSTASTVPYQPSTGSAFAVKDANYYKNLIRQHGADKQDLRDSQIGTRHSNLKSVDSQIGTRHSNLKSVHNIKPGEAMIKIQKPCIYFKSSKGCRNGSNCPYQHDMSLQSGAGNFLVTQNAKRFKLGPEIKGRT